MAASPSQHTVAEDTLGKLNFGYTKERGVIENAIIDPEDLIFPRTASRIGPKFQANVPLAPDPYNVPAGMHHNLRKSLNNVYVGLFQKLKNGEEIIQSKCWEFSTHLRSPSVRAYVLCLILRNNLP